MTPLGGLFSPHNHGSEAQHIAIFQSSSPIWVYPVYRFKTKPTTPPGTPKHTNKLVRRSSKFQNGKMLQNLIRASDFEGLA